MLINAKGVWPAFAFGPQDDWGKCLESYLLRSLERSGSEHSLIKNRQILRDFFTTYHKAPDAILHPTD
jgi:hypothetical protein